MPELPEMEALARGLDRELRGRTVASVHPYQPSTFQGSVAPDEAVGATITGVARRGKLIIVGLGENLTLVVHLMQAGRLGLTSPPAGRPPRRACLGLRVDDATELRLRELSTTHRAWARLVRGPAGADPAVAALGPEAVDLDAGGWRAALTTPPGVLHTALRQGRRVAGVGRCYASEIMWAARLPPLARTATLPDDAWDRLAAAAPRVLGDAVERAGRTITTDLPDKQGRVTAVHGHFGDPCLRCGTPLSRVAFRGYELVYCAPCQTGGREYADRRMSRLLR
ncbi:MAG: DNA-formamidopyrimidine glycosylase [Thermoleophilia bacterium]|nr:DNA-formamidopyrimidine glycosylase [Thermoleophilia bacterium]